MVGLTLPDAPVPAGSSAEVFRFLGLDADGIAGPDTQRALFADSAPHA